MQLVANILFLFLCFPCILCDDNDEWDSYIVGGDFAKIQQFPHSVYLDISCDEEFLCGASVLNQNILLSAAHCFESCQKHSNVVCLAGNENIEKVTIRRTADSIKQHNQYDDVSLKNDISLVFLGKHLPLDKNIKRIALFPLKIPVSMAMVAGWGLSDEATNTQTIKLKFVRQRIKEDADCSRLTKNEPGKMCATTFTKKGGPAPGDSGSALITSDYHQVGLVSYKTKGNPYLVVYTNVTYYYKWIVRSSRRVNC